MIDDPVHTQPDTEPIEGTEPIPAAEIIAFNPAAPAIFQGPVVAAAVAKLLPDLDLAITTAVAGGLPVPIDVQMMPTALVRWIDQLVDPEGARPEGRS